MSSSSIAAARKRRAPAATDSALSPPQQQQQQQQSKQGVGLTLPQVIEVVDRRLTALETVAKTSIPENLSDILEEYNSRHEMLADEINALKTENNTLKTTLLQLQNFTMEVNKGLLDKIASATSKH